MNWKIIKTKEDYQKAVIRMVEIFDAESNSKESEELRLLINLISDYDKEHYPLP